MATRRWRVATALCEAAVSTISETSWTIVGGTAIFLDIAGDRYFRLPPSGNARFVSDNYARSTMLPVQPDTIPRPARWHVPETSSPAIGEGPFSLSETARAIWMQRRIEKQITARPFSAVVGEVARTLARNSGEPVRSDDAALTVRAFEHAKVLRTAADRCLPRSIALALCLARRRASAHVVLGVKLAPFAAHCWVQCGAEVLNDSLEEVQRYSPILVL